LRGSNPRDLFSLRSPVACNTTSNRVWASLALANSCGLNMGPHYQRVCTALGCMGGSIPRDLLSLSFPFLSVVPPAYPLLFLATVSSPSLSPCFSPSLSPCFSPSLPLPPVSFLLQREQPRTNRLRFCCDHSSYACGHGTDAIGIWTTTKPSASHSESESFGLSNTRRLAS